MRYPVLYEKNKHWGEGGWMKHKNCKVCKIVIPELDSQCAGCSQITCRFCLKDNCCPSCIDKKCAICKEIPSILVICFLDRCKCKNLYCLTCLRDSTGMNGGESTLKACPNCQMNFSPRHPHATSRDVYTVPRYSTHFLDAKYGEIPCPRKCGEKLFRTAAQAHLQVCPNAKNKFI